jgi:leucyl/phenylalanyl-tRNA--protein transferase
MGNGIFPHVEEANEDGLLAVGGDLDITTLTEAYLNGIFPWPVSEEFPLTWFAPNPRGILEFRDYKKPKSFQKFLNKTQYYTKFNQDFSEIINACANVKRKHESGTWINQDIIQGYINLFEHGLAYCVGTYENDKLIGGLYGVCLGEIISGESMFYYQDNASKFALNALVERLEGLGLKWIDTQMVTPLLSSFGGKEVSRKVFMKKLEQLSPNCSRQEIFGN